MRERAQVRLAELLQRSGETIAPLPDTEYREITVRLWGKGVVERGRTTGLAMTGRRFIARDGQFIASRIDARNGATGLVPASLDGALVTNDFPLFELNRDRLHPPYLGWLCRTASFVELCRRASEGTTNRVRLKEEAFLALEIPLPPLLEQQRLVARIDALSKLLREAAELRRLALEEAGALLMAEGHAVFSRAANTHPVVRLGTFNPHVTSGPRNWGKNYTASGTRFYRAQDLNPEGQIVTAPKVYVDPPDGKQGRSAMPRAGDLLLVITGATVGRVACFDERQESGFVSQHVAICRLPAEHLFARYVWWGLRLPDGQYQLVGQRYGQGKPGLNLSNIRALALPQPPLAEQHRIVAELDALQAEVDALKVAQAASRVELDALLPAVLDRAFAGSL